MENGCDSSTIVFRGEFKIVTVVVVVVWGVSCLLPRGCFRVVTEAVAVARRAAAEARALGGVEGELGAEWVDAWGLHTTKIPAQQSITARPTNAAVMPRSVIAPAAKFPARDRF